MKHSAQVYSLSQLSYIRTGYTFRSKIEGFFGSDDVISIIQPRDILHSNLVDEPLKVERSSIPSLHKHILLNGDILVANKGLKFATYLFNNDSKRDMIASSSFFVITAQRDKILPEYLHWYLNQTPCKTYLSKKAIGTAIPSINKPVIENILIIVPSLTEQIKAVSIMNEIDHEIDLINKLVDKRTQLKNEYVWDLIRKNHENKQ